MARSGILVFASHSNEFLAQLCDSAMWIDHGQIRQRGGIEEVVRAYEGPDAGNHVATVLREMAAERTRETDTERTRETDTAPTGEQTEDRELERNHT